MSRKMKALIALCTALSLLAGMAAVVSAAPAKVRTMSISTGGTTGMYYTTHAPICDYLNAHSAMIRVVPSTSGGSTENVRNVINGVSELGCAYSDDMLKGYGRNKNLRFIGPTTKVSPLQFVVRADSGITKLDDLKGKHIHLGAAGSGARNWTVAFFKWAGLYDQVTEVPLGHEEIVSALGDGDVKMMTVGGLAPSARVTEASISYDIRLLDLSEYLDAFLKEYPYFEAYTIEPGTYKGVDTSSKSFGLATSLICMANLEDDVLLEYMRWVYSPEAQKAALGSNPVGPNHDPKNPLTNMSIPIHPAAKKFWEEKGFTVPELKTK